MTTNSASSNTTSETNNSSSDDSLLALGTTYDWRYVHGLDDPSGVFNSTSTDSNSSSESSDESLETGTHSHSFVRGGYYHGSDAESSHSGTRLSLNASGYTGGSNSHGTSQRTGEYSTLSTVSILLKETLDRLDNKITMSTLSHLESEPEGTSSAEHSTIWFVSDPGKEDREFGPNGGLAWQGDRD
jgi:hypothetical protein